MKKEDHIKPESSKWLLRKYIVKGFSVTKIEPELYVIKTLGIDCDPQKNVCISPATYAERGWSKQRHFIHIYFERSVSEKRK